MLSGQQLKDIAYAMQTHHVARHGAQMITKYFPFLDCVHCHICLAISRRGDFCDVRLDVTFLMQEVEHYLRVFTNYHQNDWAEWVSLAEFVYNNKAQSSTHHSPFYLNYGHHWD